jgi:hypothetical protein
VWSVDADCTIHFAPADDKAAWGRHGVLVILGNGVDVISDYHAQGGKFEQAIKATYEWIERMDSAGWVEAGAAAAKAGA